MAIKYTEDHEWLNVDADVATVGITAHAADQLGDIVFVELPVAGRALEQFATFGVVESVKAVSPLYSPVTGEIIDVNSGLPDSLETLNADPYDAGWIIKVKLTDESSLAKLLDYAAYQKQCAEAG